MRRGEERKGKARRKWKNTFGIKKVELQTDDNLIHSGAN